MGDKKFIKDIFVFKIKDILIFVFKIIDIGPLGLQKKYKPILNLCVFVFNVRNLTKNYTTYNHTKKFCGF